MQALTQQLLNVVLIHEHHLINNVICDDLMQFHRNLLRFKRVFHHTLDDIQENLPYWLKHFHGDWKLIKPTKVACIMKEQFAIDDLKRKLERILLIKKYEDVLHDYKKAVRIQQLGSVDAYYDEMCRWYDEKDK